MAQTLLKKCDLCVQKDGIYFCYQCRHALCDACRNTHNKFPALSGHIVGNIDQVNLIDFSTQYRCNSHEKEFEIYCENCSCLICSQCVTTIHKDHEFSGISQTVSKEREDAKKTVADLKTKIKNTTDLKENIKCEHLVKLKSDAQHVIRDIRETFQELTKLIESKKGIKETEIEDFEHFERQQFESILYCADSVIKKYTSTCSELENLLAEKHDITFHECYKAFTRDIDYTDSIINEPEKSKFPNFDVRSVFKEIFDHMNSKCKESLCESCIELSQRVKLLMKENTEYEERTKRDILQLDKLSTKLKDAESSFIAEKTFLQRELQSKIEEIEKSQENITDLKEQLKRMKEKCEKFELENHNVKVLEKGTDSLLEAEIAEKGVINFIHGMVNPDLRAKKTFVEEECKKQNVKFDKVSFEVEGTWDQLCLLNRCLINKCGVKTGVFAKEESDKKHNKTRQAPQLQRFLNIVKIPLTHMEYYMMKFYCADSQVLKGSPEYEEGMLLKVLEPGEKEKDIMDTVKSKKDYFQGLTSMDIIAAEGDKIDDSKWHEVQRDVSSVSPNIFCYCSNDRTTITLKSSEYEKLQTAKAKCEFMLGVKKQGKGGRRLRVIAADANYQVEKDKKTDDKSLVTSVTTSGASFSHNVSGQRSPSLPSMDMTFQTSEGIIVKVYLGDIIHLNVDCIVNAANEQLSHGGGVADVISRTAGYGFQQESNDYIQKYGPLLVTKCCTTSAGRLPYKCVIHAVGPRWFDYYDKRACAYNLKRTLENCFYEAEVQNISSVALPSISSGIYGVPKEVCCKQYCQAVLDYDHRCGKTSCLKEIHFIDKDSGMIQMIQKEFAQQLTICPSVASAGNAVSNPSS